MKGIKVLFIAGWGRSGTTILDRCLGRAAGFFSCGELRYIWDRGLIENRLCSCGRPFRECEHWRRVAEDYLQEPEETIQGIVAARDGFRSRMASRGPIPPDRHWKLSLARYTQHLERILWSLRKHTGARVLVDSSKFPSHGYALHAIGVRLSVVHLVRDSRAVAFSWQRRKVCDTGPDGPRYLDRKGPLENAVYWMAWNRAIERLWASHPDVPYMRLRYEDFVSRPSAIIQEILSMTGEPGSLDFFRGPHEVELKPGHLVGGNPSRFRTGLVRLSPDDAWRDELPATQRLLTTILTYPMLLQYGYRGLHSKQAASAIRPEDG